MSLLKKKKILLSLVFSVFSFDLLFGDDLNNKVLQSSKIANIRDGLNNDNRIVADLVNLDDSLAGSTVSKISEEAFDSCERSLYIVQYILNNYSKYYKNSNGDYWKIKSALEETAKEYPLLIGYFTQPQRQEDNLVSLKDIKKNLEKAVNYTFYLKELLGNKFNYHKGISDKIYSFKDIEIGIKKLNITLKDFVLRAEENNASFFISTRRMIYESVNQGIDELKSKNNLFKLACKYVTMPNVLFGTMWVSIFRSLNKISNHQNPSFLSRLFLVPVQLFNTLGMGDAASPIKSLMELKDAYGNPLPQGLGGIDGNLLNNISQSKPSSYLFNAGYSLVLSTIISAFWQKLDKQGTMAKKYDDLKKEIEDYVSDKAQVTQELKTSSNVYLEDPKFDNLRNQGKIASFEALIKAFSHDDKNPMIAKGISKTYLLIGETGCGKTTLINALISSLNNKGADVEYLSLDPKHFKNNKVGAEAFENADLFDHINFKIEEARLLKKVYIFMADEFHLVPAANDSEYDLGCINGLLNMLTKLQTGQQDIYGVYFIASTNKPEYLPAELIKNKSRFGEVIYLPYPDINEKLQIIKNYLKSSGITAAGINFDYIKSLLDGFYISQSEINIIIKLALRNARLERKLINTSHLEQAVYKIVYKIDRDTTTLNELTRKSCSTYFASNAFITYMLNDSYDFILSTSYKIETDLKFDHIKNMQYKSEFLKVEQGKTFFKYKDNPNFKLISKKDTISDIFRLLSGSVYIEINHLPVSSRMKEEEKEAYKIIYNYLEVPYMSEVKKQLIYEKVSAVILQAKDILKNVFSNETYLGLIKTIQSTLEEKNIISKKDMDILVDKSLINKDIKEKLCTLLLD